ncbi:VOC family protein [Paraburkholderia bannensis]|uniref:VOC family protein n=1 Tax=Paraburkholderia bannensis TaxID=765414 RepID=UPI0038BBD22A
MASARPPRGKPEKAVKTQFSIKHLDHVVLRVSDMEQSIRFYSDVLGCSVDRRRDDLGMVHMRAGSSMIDLVDIHGPLGRAAGEAADLNRRNVDHFCLRGEPFDESALREHFRHFGFALEQAVRRYGAEGEGPSVYCFDPDGNQVELKGATS